MWLTCTNTINIQKNKLSTKLLPFKTATARNYCTIINRMDVLTMLVKQPLKKCVKRIAAKTWQDACSCIHIGGNIMTLLSGFKRISLMICNTVPLHPVTWEVWQVTLGPYAPIGTVLFYLDHLIVHLKFRNIIITYTKVNMSTVCIKGLHKIPHRFQDVKRFSLKLSREQAVSCDYFSIHNEVCKQLKLLKLGK